MFRKRIRNIIVSMVTVLMYSLGLSSFAQSTERNPLPVVSARAPVWTEELGEVPLDRYTREELAQMVRDYWTPERMRSATPTEIPIIHHFQQTRIYEFPLLTQEIPETVLSQPASINQKHPKKYTAKSSESLTPSPVTGIIFYRDPVAGKNYSCTGSAVNSTSKRIVATAGHCVNNGTTHQWHQNWYFVPDYKNNQSPHGAFPAFVFWSMSEWVIYGSSTRGWNSDVAFVTTETNEAGVRVVDAVGGHGLVHGGSYSFNATILGYPENIENGEVMQLCSGTTEPRIKEEYIFVSFNECNFFKGASGGPWLSQYNGATGEGILRGVSSWIKWIANSGTPTVVHINSPYFTSNVLMLYYAANSADW